MAEEALSCFNSLLETIPGLVDELDGILHSSRERQREELLKNQPAHGVERRIKRVSKSSSLRSQRSLEDKPIARSSRIVDGSENAPKSPFVDDRPAGDEERQMPRLAQDEPAVVKEQLPHLTDSDALRLSQRKRKTMSASSGRQSGPVKYRSKQMVVVYYDGDVQKRFESVVRTIGLCRNSMRKGKMSAKVEALSRAGSSSSDDSQDDEGLISAVKINGYTPRVPMPRVLPKSDGTQAFDKADGFLDKAQALCERAAHQVLRDGDCALEIKQAKEHISSALKVGESELPALRKKAEKAAERRRKAEEAEERKKAEAAKKAPREDVLDEKPGPNSRLGSPANVVLEVDDLEADESEDEGDPADSILEALQLGKFRVRTAGTLNRYMQAT